MKQVLIFIATVFLVINTHAQSVGIGTPTPNGSAQLDITSTSRGLLIPRMTSAQRLAITTPAAGLMVYETTTNAFWYFNGIVWNQIGTGGASPWAISGNNITNSNTGNVGVGTSTPNTDAILDINSSTKGVLFPRMTTLQRLTISTPPNGLMVYDTDKDQLYHYTGTIWLSVLNSSFWSRPITSRNRIANSTDSVGIGTVSPTEWLDVDGNIRSRNDLRADGRVVATGLVSSASGLSTSGGLTVGSNGLIGGNFTANGELTTNSGININNAGGTLQLKNGSGVNKGFFQISGDNVRLGTNSGNATGDLIIRMNGADRMTVRENGNVGIGNTGSSVYKLYVTGDTYNDGNINIDGKITKQSSSGSANLIPLCYGKVSANGTMLSGTNNVTVRWVSTGSGFFEEGYYTITCTGITNNSIIVVTDNSIYGGSPAPNYIFGITASYFNSGVARVYASWHILAAEEVYNTQTDFSFIIYNY